MGVRGGILLRQHHAFKDVLIKILNVKLFFFLQFFASWQHCECKTLNEQKKKKKRKKKFFRVKYPKY